MLISCDDFELQKFNYLNNTNFNYWYNLESINNNEFRKYKMTAYTLKRYGYKLNINEYIKLPLTDAKILIIVKYHNPNMEILFKYQKYISTELITNNKYYFNWEDLIKYYGLLHNYNLLKEYKYKIDWNYMATNYNLDKFIITNFYKNIDNTILFSKYNQYVTDDIIIDGTSYKFPFNQLIQYNRQNSLSVLMYYDRLIDEDKIINYIKNKVITNLDYIYNFIFKYRYKIKIDLLNWVFKSYKLDIYKLRYIILRFNNTNMNNLRILYDAIVINNITYLNNSLKLINWDYIAKYSKLTIKFILDFNLYIDLNLICQYQSRKIILSPVFHSVFYDKINYKTIIKRFPLSPKSIKFINRKYTFYIFNKHKYISKPMIKLNAVMLIQKCAKIYLHKLKINYIKKNLPFSKELINMILSYEL